MLPPAPTPVTTPPPAPGPGVMVATERVPLLHVPPGIASDNVVVSPEHIVVTPVIAAGSGLTVTTVVVKQPVGNVYVIVLVCWVAGNTNDPPVTVVDVDGPTGLTDATATELLLHVPPPVTFVSVVVSPEHIVVLPVIAAGNGFTVMPIVRKHPVPIVYVIVAGPPGAPPYTVPILSTDAITTLVVVHVPPVVPSVKLIVDPTQTAVGPIIGTGNGFTVTTVEVKHPVANE